MASWSMRLFFQKLGNGVGTFIPAMDWPGVTRGLCRLLDEDGDFAAFLGEVSQGLADCRVPMIPIVRFGP